MIVLLKQKDINLLKAYEQKDQPERIKPWMKYTVLPIGLCVITGGIFGYVAWNNHIIEQDIAAVNEAIAKLEAEQSQGEKQEKFTQLQQLRSSYNTMQTLYDHMSSYPKLGSAVIDGVFTASGAYVSIESLSYDQSTGVISIALTTPYVTQSDQVIRRLKATGLFDDVGYAGYTSELEALSPVPETTTPKEEDLSGLSDDELKNAIIKKLLENEAATTQNNTQKTGSLVYHLNISCTLKKAVSGE